MKKEKRNEIVLNLSISVLGAFGYIIILKIVKFILGFEVSRETYFLIIWMGLLSSIVIIISRRNGKTIKKRLDLLARMIYQAPFVEEIKEDADEKKKYCESICRKINSIASYYRTYGDIDFCSYYIGCLAFLANEKRAGVPWEDFKRALLNNFLDEVLEEKISRFIIDDHYEGKWDDLYKEAERVKAEKRF